MKKGLIIGLFLLFVFILSIFFFAKYSDNFRGKITGNAVITYDSQGWTPWLNRDFPDSTGDWENLAAHRANYINLCSAPLDIQCQTITGLNYTETGEIITCTTTAGLICENAKQPDKICNYNYKVKFKCPVANLCGNGIIDAGENCSGCPADVSCLEDEECVEGECVLIEEQLTGECATDADCLNETCVNGICVAEETPEETSVEGCTNDSDCLEDELCVSGECIFFGGCATEEDCLEDELCVGGICMSTYLFSGMCANDSDCYEGELCLEGICMSGDFSSGVCTNDSDCYEGELCLEGICMSEDVLAGMCGSDSDCSAGELCIDGTCVGGDLSGGICDGCYENDKCYKIGFVKGTDYCSEYFVFVPRLGAKEFCVENYECLSNLCSNGGCAREAGFLKRLIEWLRDSIGGKEKIQLSLIEAYNDAGGYTNDKVIFQDSSGQTYETAFGSEGEGVLSINGKNVPVLFADTPNIVGDEYVLVGDQFVSEKGLALKLTEVFNDVGTYANDKVVFEDNKGGEYSAVFVIEGKGLLTIYGQVFNIILRSDQGVRIDKHLIFKNRYKNNIHVFDIDGDFNTVTLRI